MSKQARPRDLAETEAMSYVKALRVSPRKLNLVAQSIRGKTASASFTFLPRIMSTTSRAFCADPRKYFAFAIASMTQSLNAGCCRPASVV